MDLVQLKTALSAISPGQLELIFGEARDENIDCYLEGFGPDGACVEGLSYWTYGFGFFTYFASLLKQRTGGGLDLFQNPKVKQIALFQQQCYLFENQVVSFSDASPTENYQPGLTQFLKKTYPEVELPERRFQAKLGDDHVARWAHVIRNLVWYEPSFVGGLPAEAVYYLPDAQWFITRKSLPGKTVCFATKGGHNDEPHNHNDVGSFILNVNGDNLLTDPGRSQYTRQYFGAERYTFFCPSSRGHSVPIVAGEYQKPGREYSARRFELQRLTDSDQVVIDLTGAYGDGHLKSLVRKFMFIPVTPTPELILKDEYLFQAIPVQIGERLVTSFKPQRIADGLIRITGLHNSVDIIFKPDIFEVAFFEERFTSQEGQLQTVYLIDFTLIATTSALTAEFRFRVH